MVSGPPKTSPRQNGPKVRVFRVLKKSFKPLESGPQTVINGVK